MQTSTLRPGLLVSLNTSISGNVSYQKEMLAEAHVVENGAEKAEWRTERTITDPAEHERACKVRSKIGSLIRSVCAHSAFGLLCPEANANELEMAIDTSRALADDFNKNAALTRVYVHVLTGRIAPDDVEAVKAINSEVRDLMNSMADGIKNLDVKAVREAANRAKSVSSMLSPDAADRAQVAIDVARSAAKKIVKAGEQASQEIDTQAIRQITEMRTAFLDLEPMGEVASPSIQGRTLDLAPESFA